MPETDEALKRVHDRIDETNSDMGKLELRVQTHNTILMGEGKVPGLVSEVVRNTEFREQVANDIRKIFYLFLGQGIIVFIAVMIWAITQMN